MPRIALCVEYDGSRYCGWQRQRHSPSVQETLEKAISRVSNGAAEVFCAGRTDTGVHASGQVVHLDSVRNTVALTLGVNTYLPPDVRVKWAVETDDSFHARFSAEERRYRYLIRNSHTRSALLHQRCWTVYQQLDIARMRSAATALVGRNDFSAFRAAGCQAKHPNRHVRQLRVAEHANWIVIDITANAFLQHMVRNIVGLLVHIGAGRAPVDEARRVLETRDRTQSASAAPADGLFLSQVLYPSRFGLPGCDANDQPLLPILPLLPP
ncbi:MAG: tRNA pseudouridine(38-40) synthase TruA [Pseudomonadota bacterium]